MQCSIDCTNITLLNSIVSAIFMVVLSQTIFIPKKIEKVN